MKDIKDYFKKSSDDPKNVNKTGETSEKTSKTRSSKSIELEENNEEEKTKIKSRRKKHKIRISENSTEGPADRAIIKASKLVEKRTKATQSKLSENSTKHIPPNDEKRKNTDGNEVSEKENRVLEIIDDDSVEIEPDNQNSSAITTPKISTINAFQFLMNSRNKVIGSNSPGRNQSDNEEVFTEESREKLAARRKILQNWSDSKKSKKRKLEDDEIDKCIKVKLEVRKKRLKTLLRVDDPGDENSLDHCAEQNSEHVSKEAKLVKQSSLSNFGITFDNSSNESFEIADKDVESKSVDESERNKLSISNKKMSRKNKKAKHSSGDDFEDNCKTEDDLLQLNIKQKKNKHKNKKKVRDDKKESSCSSKNTKHWKMKIKLNDAENVLNSVQTEDDIKESESTEVYEEHSQNGVAENIKLEGNDRKETKNLKDSFDEEVVEDVIMVSEESKVEIVHSIEETVVTNNKKKSSKRKELASIENNENGISPMEIDSNSLKNGDSGRVLRNRASLQKPKNDSYIEYSTESSEEEEIRGTKKSVKVAPVFAKAVPKPKVNPEVLEARRKFLMSEMPLTLKKKIERQDCVITCDFDVFPKISHIRQEDTKESFWNLPDPQLPTKKYETYNLEREMGLCKSLIDHSALKESKFEQSEPINCIKTIVRDLKSENTDYPVYRSFRLLKEKGVIEMNDKKNTPKRRSKSKQSSKQKKSDVNDIKPVELSNMPPYLMWTEKYKPRNSEDLIGNFQAVSALKKWLETWYEAFKSGKKITRTNSSDSESDFVSSDAESISGGSSLTTTIILTGPCGSGKSSSVYSICNEFGFQVIEVNASSRRTGKQIIQELQEATQSHQVRKNKETILAFTKSKKDSKPELDKQKNKSKKMCVLLIEDIDIVFEQDEGFISAISQISAISKRPIILTTSDEKSLYSRKFMNDFKTIKFRPLSAKTLGIWLQVLCLIEGIFVDISSIGEFLEYNKGDVRKTLLQLQFWIQSGGQIKKHNTLYDNIFRIDNTKQDDEIVQTDDDFSNLSCKENDSELNYRIHTNLVSDFEIFKLENFYNIPSNIDLQKIWWNIPKYLNIESSNDVPWKFSKKSKRNKRKLKLISDMYDSLAICDVSYRKASFRCDTPVCKKRWNECLQDSLELEKNPTEYDMNEDLIFEWNHYLMDRCLNACKERFAPSSTMQRLINMAAPGVEYESKLSRNHDFEEEFMIAVPVSSHLDRKSVSLDYLPTLRNIARSEKKRSQNTWKRHNRFHNYLQNLNIDCNKSVINFATSALAITQ